MEAYVRPSKDIDSISRAYNNALSFQLTDAYIVESDLEIFIQFMKKCYTSLNSFDYNKALIIGGNDLIRGKIDSISEEIKEVEEKFFQLKTLFVESVKVQRKKELTEILEVAKELQTELGSTISSTNVGMQQILDNYIPGEWEKYENQYNALKESHDWALDVKTLLDSIINNIETDLSSL